MSRRVTEKKAEAFGEKGARTLARSHIRARLSHSARMDREFGLYKEKERGRERGRERESEEGGKKKRDSDMHTHVYTHVK